MAEEKYPEHDKLKKVRELSQACGEFLEHLNQTGILLARHHEHTEDCGHVGRHGYAAECDFMKGDLVPVRTSKEKLLASHFGINLVKLEDEKREMLEELRELREASDG